MKFSALGVASLGMALGLCFFSTASLAHHSFAMFDAEKTVKLDGTVRQFLWTNPHSWIVMMVKNAQGMEEQWSIEMGGPAGLARDGWRANTLTPGMNVSALVHPLRDGTRGGQFMIITLPDGTTKGTANAAPGNDAGGLPAVR